MGELELKLVSTETGSGAHPNSPLVSAQIKAILLAWVNALIRRASSWAAGVVRTMTCEEGGGRRVEGESALELKRSCTSWLH